MKLTVFELGIRAQRVCVDQGKVVVEFADGREIRFPISANRKLRQATPDQRADVELICGGTGIHWPQLDEDLSIVGIIEGRYGAP
jgi:hypothetical protein